MSSSLDLRPLRTADLPFADSVRASAGWNQTLADWQRFLAMEPDGCFLAECDGVPAGTATTTVYGAELAWIGMVIVHPDFRRRGIGKALLERCVVSLQTRGVRCIKLDATPAGKRVYDQMGFKSEWTLQRWERLDSGHRSMGADSGVRECRWDDWEAINYMDSKAFGVPRLALLRHLMSQSPCSLVLEDPVGRVGAFGLARPGSRAFYIGPVTATHAANGVRLLNRLHLACGPGPAFCDIPDQNTAAVRWALEQGYKAQRPLTRMYLGENLAPGDPEKQFALAGPEVG